MVGKDLAEARLDLRAAIEQTPVEPDAIAILVKQRGEIVRGLGGEVVCTVW